MKRKYIQDQRKRGSKVQNKKKKFEVRKVVNLLVLIVIEQSKQAALGILSNPSEKKPEKYEKKHQKVDRVEKLIILLETVSRLEEKRK